STINVNSQWQADVGLTNDSADSRLCLNNARSIASSGEFVHIIWFEARDGIYTDEIYYKRSTDGGISWEAVTRLTNAPAQSWGPSVSVSGQVVHIVWEDNRDADSEIYYKRSTDGGISWGADMRLINNSAISQYQSLSVSGVNVHVVWHDTRNGSNGEIYYIHSTDGGISWGQDTRLTNNPAPSGIASITVSGQVVHVVWYDLRDGNTEIYYKRSTDGGISWGADTRLTNDPAFSENPSVSITGQDVHVVWYEARDGNAEISYKRSTDEGINWGADMRLTNNTPLYMYHS